MIKSSVSCGFGHIYWRNPSWKTSFCVQCNLKLTSKKLYAYEKKSVITSRAELNFLIYLSWFLHAAAFLMLFSNMFILRLTRMSWFSWVFCKLLIVWPNLDVVAMFREALYFFLHFELVVRNYFCYIYFGVEFVFYGKLYMGMKLFICNVVFYIIRKQFDFLVGSSRFLFEKFWVLNDLILNLKIELKIDIIALSLECLGLTVL